MSAKIGRNDPCPCGSGKKYKQCHLGRADDPGRRELPDTTGEVAPHATELAHAPDWTRYVPWVLGGVGGVGTAVLWATQGTQAGLPALGGTVLVVTLAILFSNPPPPRDDSGDPAGLNFGRKN